MYQLVSQLLVYRNLPQDNLLEALADICLELDSGATVYDALVAIGTKAGIDIGAQNSSYGVYVNSIGGITAGGAAGWMYSVNGAVPMVGAGSYVLTNNDVVRLFCVNY